MEADLKNITRYTYETASFMGWRVAFSRRGRYVVQYFADLEYGGEDASLKAAMELRDSVRESLAQAERYVDEVFSQIVEHVQQQIEAKKRRNRGRWTHCKNETSPS